MSIVDRWLGLPPRLTSLPVPLAFLPVHSSRAGRRFRVRVDGPGLFKMGPGLEAGVLPAVRPPTAQLVTLRSARWPRRGLSIVVPVTVVTVKVTVLNFSSLTSSYPNLSLCPAAFQDVS